MSESPATRLLDLHPRDWPAWFQERGAPAFQGRNAARWVFQRGATQWEEMTDLPSGLREQLAEEQPLVTAICEARSEAGDGAVKLLLRFPDGASVEAVGMPGTMGRTLCLSSQVGCAVRCAFCASGMEGVERNLSRAEILEQALYLRREQGEFHRIVMMGMGEPGNNLDAVLAALDSLIDPEGMDFAARRVTLSTVGPKGALEQIALWGKSINLALSLHAPDDALRHELVPGVRKRSIQDTLDEADRLFATTGREYTVEYVLLAGVNDSIDQAEALLGRLRGRRCHINLIPYNPVPEFGFQRPDHADQEAFAWRLRESGLSVTLRRSLGRQNDAACGQLRRRTIQPPRPRFSA